MDGIRRQIKHSHLNTPVSRFRAFDHSIQFQKEAQRSIAQLVNSVAFGQFIITEIQTLSPRMFCVRKRAQIHAQRADQVLIHTKKLGCELRMMLSERLERLEQLRDAVGWSQYGNMAIS